MKIGFAICGSFCTFSRIIPQLEALKSSNYELLPIMSPIAYSTDTRFGKASDFTSKIEEICGCKIIKTIPEAEPIGPKKLLDALIVAPATGNTMAKLACGICDTSVTMAAKAHLRSDRPLVLALCSNDALSANLQNISILLERKNVFFVPMRQDDPSGKPHSLVCEFSLLDSTFKGALERKQIQPLFI